MAPSRAIRALFIALLSIPATALERQDVTFQVFQFPASMKPRIDGNPDDWSIVPDSYAITMSEFMDTEQGHGMNHDPKKMDVKIKVGWVKGENRLYFLYEAYKGYWDFSLPGLHNDIFEVVVDGDLSGGPLIDQYHREIFIPEMVGKPASVLDPRIDRETAQRQTHGVTAQELSHFHSAGSGQELGDGVGLPAVRHRSALFRARLQLQLQARRIRQAGAGVLHHSVRLFRVRRSMARTGDPTNGEQAYRHGIGPDRLGGRGYQNALWVLEYLSPAVLVR
jgi:hypothetical protein